MSLHHVPVPPAVGVHGRGLEHERGQSVQEGSVHLRGGRGGRREGGREGGREGRGEGVFGCEKRIEGKYGLSRNSV